MNNPDQRIQEIVKSITCYDYLKMDDKSYKFLEEKAVKAIKSELQQVADAVRLEERKKKYPMYKLKNGKLTKVAELAKKGEDENI
jgi:hypothetical protein